MVVQQAITIHTTYPPYAIASMHDRSGHWVIAVRERTTIYRMTLPAGRLVDNIIVCVDKGAVYHSAHCVRRSAFSPSPADHRLVTSSKDSAPSWLPWLLTHSANRARISVLQGPAWLSLYVVFGTFFLASSSRPVCHPHPSHSSPLHVPHDLVHAPNTDAFPRAYYYEH